MGGESRDVADLRARRRSRLFAVLALLGLVLTSLAGGRPAGAVVGGTEVPEGKYRFMASLQDQGSHFCGASVIASRWALTAAHCVAGDTPKGLSIVVGSVDNTAGRRIKVTRIAVSPMYDADALANDVALLRLARAAKVPAIRLAGTTDDALWQAGARVITAGWGSQVPIVGAVPTPLDNKMREVPLEVVGDAECSTAPAPGVQICAAELLKDSCQGDSGGPLFARDGGTLVQVGLVSGGIGCAVPELPGYYAEIGAPSLRSFIRSVTGV